MSKFKVGDKVKYVGETKYSQGCYLKNGETYTVLGLIGPYGYLQLCQIQLDHGHGWANYGDFELVKQTIDWTKPVQTRDGRKVEVLTRGALGRFPVIVNIEGDKESARYSAEGKWLFDGGETDHNLINVPEKPVKIVRYFNIYARDFGGPYKSRKEADASADKHARIGCKRVVFTSGEFDE